MRTWPIIRHIRYFALLCRVRRAYAPYGEFDYLAKPENDEAVLDAIWSGKR